jgi:Pyridoxamine 5''-phosphate oxidase.
MATRSKLQRQRDFRRRLAEDRDLWLASASPTGNAYLVPLSFAWDGTGLVMATPAHSPTARNILENSQTRLAIGTTRDVNMVEGDADTWLAPEVPGSVADAFATKLTWDPRTERLVHLYIRVRPTRIQAWREADEIPGREVMRDGRWL